MRGSINRLFLAVIRKIGAIASIAASEVIDRRNFPRMMSRKRAPSSQASKRLMMMPLVLNTTMPLRIIAIAREVGSSISANSGPWMPSETSTRPPSASDSEICETLKTILNTGRPDMASAMAVAMAITMIAPVGDPRSMSVNANAQLGVTTPPVT